MDTTSCMGEEKHTERNKGTIVDRCTLRPGYNGHKGGERIIGNSVEFANVGELVLARTDNEFDLVNYNILFANIIGKYFSEN